MMGCTSLPPGPARADLSLVVWVAEFLEERELKSAGPRYSGVERVPRCQSRLCDHLGPGGRQSAGGRGGVGHVEGDPDR